MGCGRPAAPAATRAPSVSARIAPAPNSRCLRTLFCFTLDRGASDAGSRDTTRERRRSRGGLASPRISHMRAPSSKQGPTGRRPGFCRAPAFDTPRAGRLRGCRAARGPAGGCPLQGGAARPAPGGPAARAAASPVATPTAATGCGSGTSAARAAATWRGSPGRRSGTGSRPSTSRARTGATPGASSPRPRLLPPLPRSPRLRLAVRLRQPSRAEAKRGAQAVRKGADCLVIDAESPYEGRYAAADKYINKLRSRIGSSSQPPGQLSVRGLPPRRCPIPSSWGPAARGSTSRRSTGTRSASASARPTSTPSSSTASTDAPSARSARLTPTRPSRRSNASAAWRSRTASTG